MNKHQINFYKKNNQFGYFSNFFHSPFKQGNFFYQTNEHYFQSKKFEGQQYQKKIISSESPAYAFDLGRSLQHPIRNDWEQVKDQIMYKGLKLKFTQNLDLKEKLLDTENRKIVQHTDRDSYWGDGGNGSGKNRLGVLLMKLRNQLRQNKQ